MAHHKQREREKERKRPQERETERKRERLFYERKKEIKKVEKERERKTDQKSAGVDVSLSHVTNVTAATVQKLGSTSSRPAFEEKRGKERERLDKDLF